VARAWLAIEQKEDPRVGAREALHLLDGTAPDPLAASVELEARRLGGQRALGDVAAREAALEDSATDLAGELEKRALDDMGFAPYASPGEQSGVWERCLKRAGWAVALAPRRAGAAAIAAGAELELRNADASRRYLACARSWNEGHPLVLLWEGVSALHAKDGKGAAASLSAALGSAPETLGSETRLWELLAGASLYAKDADGAEKASRKARELEPSSRVPLELLLQAARVRGDQAAIDSAQAALDADGDGPRRAAALELDARGSDSPDREVSLLEEASRLAPRELAIFCSLCFARFRQGDMLGAWRAWMRALELAPYYGRYDLEECGFIGTGRLRQLGNGADFADAIAALQEREPRAAEVHFLAAWVEWTRSELPGEDRAALRDRAISDLDRALAVDHRFSIAWALRGHLRALRGEVGAARADLDRALQVRVERMPIAHVYRASLHASLGETEAAFGELELAARQGYQDRGRLLKLPGIDALRDDPRYRPLLGRLTDAPVTGFSEGF
jgi:tetratricopeptide (TPR) repeat protein